MIHISEYRKDYKFAGFINISAKKYRILKLIFALVSVVIGVFLGIAIIDFIVDLALLIVFNNGATPNIILMQTLPTLIFWIVAAVVVGIVYKSGKAEKVRIEYVEKKK